MSKSDFFGDDNSDIVFQNSDGAVALWDMSGTSDSRRRCCGGTLGRPGTSRARLAA